MFNRPPRGTPTYFMQVRIAKLLGDSLATIRKSPRAIYPLKIIKKPTLAAVISGIKKPPIIHVWPDYIFHVSWQDEAHTFSWIHIPVGYMYFLGADGWAKMCPIANDDLPIPWWATILWGHRPGDLSAIMPPALNPDH